MSKLTDNVGLTQTYTNHSIRATGVTIPTKYMSSSAQIMAVTNRAQVNTVTYSVSNDRHG